MEKKLKMIEFNSKKELFDYLVRKFRMESEVILVRGSTSFRPIKQFSDVDVEVYTKKDLKRPYYKIILFNGLLILISVYFEKYKEGKLCSLEKNVRVLYGSFNDNLKPSFEKEDYSPEEKIKRECQLLVDAFFKYLRTKNKKYLEKVRKRI